MTQTRPRRRPLTHQEKLALQERKQRRREKMEESRELAKGPIDLTFCLLVMLLTAIGLVILLSASFPSAYYEKAPSRHNPLYYFEKQGVFAVLGTAVMLLVSKFNYQRLRGAGRALIYVSVIFLILVIIPHNPIAVTAKGATRWLKISHRKSQRWRSLPTLPTAFPEKRTKCGASATVFCLTPLFWW